MKRIAIKKSSCADTRTCDWSKVTKEQLKTQSESHIRDVSKALHEFAHMLDRAAVRHDWTKLDRLDHFHSDFKTGFKTTGWWDSHRVTERHHLSHDDGVREDVDLIDVLEYLADCVMAGMARSGDVRAIEIRPIVLVRAFNNTIEKLQSVVVVEGVVE